MQYQISPGDFRPERGGFPHSLCLNSSEMTRETGNFFRAPSARLVEDGEKRKHNTSNQKLCRASSKRNLSTFTGEGAKSVLLGPTGARRRDAILPREKMEEAVRLQKRI